MAKIAKLIQELEDELESKETQREGILDYLALIDVRIDEYDELIKNIDKAVVKLTDEINDAITPVKEAYDERISSGCRSNLIWELKDSYERWSKAYAWNGGVREFRVYEVVVNEDLNEQINYHGAKYYQKPSNRDYGSEIIGDFQGIISAGSTALAIHESTFEVGPRDTLLYPQGIQVGDKIIDDVDNPQLFSTNDVPEIVSIGTTSFVGVVENLVGGIGTGSTIFRHFGSGDFSAIDLTQNMGLRQPDVDGQIFVDNLFEDKYANIVGVGTDIQEIEFFDSNGNLAVAEIDIDVAFLDRPALYAVEEATFTVGVVTTAGAFYLSTASSSDSGITTFYAIRQDLDNIDAGFDVRGNPHSPVRIGVIGSGNLGVGHSVYYDTSGNPTGPEKWRPETAHDEIKIKGGDIPAKEEPKIGAGNAPYNTGYFQWPTKTITSSTSNTGRGFSNISNTSYAPLGTKVTIGGTTSSISIGYAATSSENPSSGSCSNIDDKITETTNNMNSVISKNESVARRELGLSETLRDKRSDMELQAWSLLQASASLREDIAKLKTQIRKLKDGDFRPYEK